MATLTKEAGDISSVFPSLSGKKLPPLPQRYSDLKKTLAHDQNDAITASWHRLLRDLRTEAQEIREKGNNVSLISP